MFSSILPQSSGLLYSALRQVTNKDHSRGISNELSNEFSNDYDFRFALLLAVSASQTSVFTI